MGSAPLERRNATTDEHVDSAEPAGSVAVTDAPPKDAMRSWLARGIHSIAIDPRRLGGGGIARRLLGQDRAAAADPSGGWRELVSAMQRHALHSALFHLTPEERQVVTFAYLRGFSNRQIATMLGISVSMARRRLSLALQHLDDYLHSTGRWISAVLLVGLAFASERATRAGRFVNAAASADWPHKLAATAVVGTVAVAGFGLTSTYLDASRHTQFSPSRIKPFVPGLPSTERTELAKVVVPADSSPQGIPGSDAKTATKSVVTTTSSESETAGNQSQQGAADSQVEVKTTPPKEGCKSKQNDENSSRDDHEGGTHLTSGDCDR